MANIKINTEACIGCGACVNACPVHVFVLESDKAKTTPKIADCILCKACETTCPVGAIKVIE